MDVDTVAILIIIGGLLFFGCIFTLIIVVSVQYTKKRREAWQAIAETLGFSYTESDTALPETYSQFKLFQQGRARRADNILRGSHGGITALLFDYRYTTGSGKNNNTHVHTLCLVEDENLALPDLLLRKQVRVFDFLGKLFGGQDVNFEDDPEFSKSFILQGIDENAVRKVFSPAIRSAFMQKWQDMGYELMGRGKVLVLLYRTHQIPNHAPDILQEAFSLVSLFKSP